MPSFLRLSERGKTMIHLDWKDRETKKRVKCIHTKAQKYTVESVLTEGKLYDVKNETEEFYFIVDNSGEVGAFEKTYFEEVKQ